MFGLVCISFLIIGFGVLQLAAPDLMWSWQEFGNQLAGRTSERTEVWDMGRAVSGVILIIAGAGLGLWGWSVQSENASRETRATETAQMRSTEAADVASTLDAFAAPAMNTFLEDADPTPVHARAIDYGLAAGPQTEINFGRCESSGEFYLYVIDYDVMDDYLYSTTGSPCRHPYLFVSSMDLLGQSDFGGRWYRVPFLRNNAALATAAYAPLATLDAAPTVTPLGN